MIRKLIPVILILFISQLALIYALMFTQQSGSLCRWDGEWYAHIVDHGYVSDYPPKVQIKDKGNVAFFPVYPLIADGVKYFTHLPTDWALVVTSQLFALGVLFYFLLVLIEMGITDPIPQIERLWFALVYPYAFFYFVSYSESVFVFFMLGFIYWFERWLKKPTALAYLLALAHGILLTGTRMVGIFVLAYPVIRAFLQFRFRFPTWKAGFLSIFSLLGVASFIYYCQEHFGHWDLYFTTVKIGWDEYTDVRLLFPPKDLYLIDWSHVLKSDNIGRLFTMTTIFLQIGLLIKQIRTKSADGMRLSFILLSMIILWGTMYGRSSYHFAGMGRYLLPALILLIPILDLPRGKWVKFLTVVAALIAIGFQVFFVLMFSRRGWVA